MENHLKLTSEDLYWLSRLSVITSNKDLINFIVGLDDTYKGADSYLCASDLPGRSLTEALYQLSSAHPKFLANAYKSLFKELSFFKLGLRLAGVNGEVWKPMNEPLKAFVARYANREIIYYENKKYYEVVSHYERKFSCFAKTIQKEII